MAQRCRYCAGLSIEVLVDLAKQEFSGRCMPENAVYHHHKSLPDLESSANDGCDLCTLILDCFRNLRGSFIRHDISSVDEKVDLTDQLEESFFHQAKDLPSKGIRISINAHHLSGLDTIYRVLAFDQIYVDLEKDRTQQPDYDSRPRESRTVVLTLTSPYRKKKFRVGTYEIGRFPTDPDLGSPRNFDIARAWLRDCQENHVSCHRPTELPTRVIDVGTDTEPGILRIFCSRGEPAQYVILSHCWGGIDPLLTTDTIENFQQSIPFDEIPANFRDAIIVTRQLGIRYLWIDSLCILQDSTEDWKVESKKMGYYYSHATLTILAQCSERSTQGFLKPRVDNIKTKPVKLDVTLGAKDKRQVTVEWLPYEREDILSFKHNSHLASRGWTLQEDLLSPRKLYYGNQQIHWKCYEVANSAEGVPSSDFSLLHQFALPFEYKFITSILEDDLPSEDQSSPVDTEELLREFYGLIQMYSMKNFTKKSDRLPAFSGLARRIHKYLEGEYLAGVWGCDFNRGLDWECYDGMAGPGFDTCGQRGLRTSKERERSAPSWSWASAEQVMRFYMLPCTDESTQPRVLECQMAYQDPTNPYGKVDAGHLLVEGYAMPVFERTQITSPCIGEIQIDDPGVSQHGESYVMKVLLYLMKDDDNKSILAVDEVPEGQSKERDSVVFPLQEHIVLIIRQKKSHAGCMLLRKVVGGKDEQFERIGHVQIESSKMPDISEWSRRKLIIV
ncbi:HET-domain-containing protein [Rostrohypoxylon terebratum]|nr:HET-domain-containing protein [Rostrohypoxylon terebratum]